MASEANSSNDKAVLTPYFGLKNGIGFSAFAQKVFGAKELKIRTSPEGNLITHGELDISGCKIMYVDSEEPENRNGGAAIYVKNCDETYNKAIAEGATSINAPTDQQYGRMGGVKDPFGTTWWITEAPKDAEETKEKDSEASSENKLNLPPNEQVVMSYLMVKDAQKFSDFLKKVFNAEEVARIPQEGDASRIQHAESVISGYKVMFGDGPEETGYQTGLFKVAVGYVDDYYNRAVPEGITVKMEPADSGAWGRFCGFIDPCGNTWWLDNPPKIEKRAAPEGGDTAAKEPETQDPDVEKKVKTA